MGIRAAVVGTGFIGPVHIEALQRIGVEVVGLCGSHPERAKAKAQLLGIPRVYSRYEDLIADPSVDVVHIATPNVHHYPQARAAILAGKHVVCEKPFTMTSRESEELVELATKYNVVHAVCYNIRFYPMVQHARAMIRHGDLGNIRIIHGSYLQDWLLLETDWNWRLIPEMAGETRAVGDIGSHWIDLMVFLTGLHVKRVFADFAIFLSVRKRPRKPVETFETKSVQLADYVEEHIRTEDYAAILLHFEGGAWGVLTVSQVSPGRKNRLWFEIDGAWSSVTWDSEEPNTLWIGHRDKPNGQLIKDPALMDPSTRQWADYPGGHSEGYPDTFKMLFRAIYAHISDRNTPIHFPTFEDGHEMMKVLEAIVLSAREGRWVEIPT